jgi:hypothetical protein
VVRIARSVFDSFISFTGLLFPRAVQMPKKHMRVCKASFFNEL